ncbi:hypothetical protein CYMTET_17823 [Cymbomonas tetramitiformis]|uniref:Uncharacterized protein n=1 Tax=Cymbomonas tetramitiformis TaxID=36881 RepID=A0AAE0G9B9_9CHLO|nr:hypothetical protein CYMTET_17823 [Cymbomonas tetramitiformis]
MFSRRGDDEVEDMACRAMTPESERAFETMLKPFVMRLAFRSFGRAPRASDASSSPAPSCALQSTTRSGIITTEVQCVARLLFYALVYTRYRDLILRLEEIGGAGNEWRHRWRVLNERWCCKNASRVADYLEWVASKAKDASDHDDLIREQRDVSATLSVQYAEGRFPLKLSGETDGADSHTTTMRLLATLALMEDALRGGLATRSTLGHVVRALDLSEAAVNLLRGVRTPGEMTPCAWWWMIDEDVDRSDSDKHLEQSGARWMHMMNRFLNDEYVSLMDDVCRCFGVEVAVNLTGDRASWWKPRKEDAVACAEFVAGMSTAERARCEERFRAVPNARLGYHIPVCVAVNGYYAREHDREVDLLRLFDRITGHIRRGDRMFVWLCERVDEALAKLQARAYVGDELVVSDPGDTKELHDGVVAQVTGVKVVRLCTLSSAEARLAQSHTRSDAFAGVVQMVCAMRAKWRWGDPRVEKAYTDLRAYVFRLREAQRLICDDFRIEDAPTSTEAKSGTSSRHDLLDAFLEVLVESDASLWTAHAAMTMKTHDDDDDDVRRRLSSRTDNEDFLRIMLRCARHPFKRAEQRQEPRMHGLFVEVAHRTAHAPVFALPPTFRAARDTVEARIGCARLRIWNPAPLQAPITADRLCRRLYRPLPIRHDTEDAANVFLRNHVYRACPVWRRRSELASLCDFSTPTKNTSDAHEEYAMHRITSEEFARELVVMREERRRLDPQETADNLAICTFEFTF